jgi:hypothetical protein
MTVNFCINGEQSFLTTTKNRKECKALYFYVLLCRTSEGRNSWRRRTVSCEGVGHWQKRVWIGNNMRSLSAEAAEEEAELKRIWNKMKI